MKKVKEELKLGVIFTLSFVGGCYLMGEFQKVAYDFLCGHPWVAIIGLPLVMFIVGIAMIGKE